MKRLIIDFSSVGKQSLHAAERCDSAKTVVFEGKEVRVPDHKEGYEIFLLNLKRTLKTFNLAPFQIILVEDSKTGKQYRRQWLPGYSIRPPSAPEWREEFTLFRQKVVDTVLAYGGIVVSKEGMEADDVIYSLSDKLDAVIWSTDKDLLACNADFYNGELNPDKFFGIAKDHIAVFKALVGDQVDHIPGVKGVGEKTFIDMVAKYGDEGLEDLRQLLEEECLEELAEYVKDFPAFQKVIDNADTAYACYKCAKMYHPGWKLDWKMAYLKGDGTFPEWNQKIRLIGKSDLTPEFLAQLQKDIDASPAPTLDIETWTDEESEDWCNRNKSKTGKKPIDIFGSKLAGFSITSGSNNHITYYFTYDHIDSDNITLDDVATILNMLPEKKLYGVHNSSFEIPVIRNHVELKFDRGYLPQGCFDTRIGCGFVDEYERPHLKHWSKLLMNYDQVTFEEVLGDAKNMHEKRADEVVYYGCDDTICTSALMSFEEVIMKYEGSWDGYMKCDLGTQFLYAESFLTGVKFDMDKLAVLQKENMEKYEEISHTIKDYLMNLSWEEFEDVEPEEAELYDTPATTMAEIMARAKAKAQAAPKRQEGKMVAKRWPGCEYVPATEFSGKEYKRIYLEVKGKRVTEKSIRTMEKLQALTEDFPELKIVTTLEELNKVGEDFFVPNPELNLRSPKQLCHLLYTALGFPVRIKNKRTEKQRENNEKANPASNESAIKHAIANDADEAQKEFLGNIIKAKSCLTEESLFYRPYQQLPSPKDGYVHASPGQALSKSGRAAYNKPNFGQISARSRVREVLVPLEPDHCWVSFDVTSQELLITACQSGDENMLSCFRGERKDIHSITGTAIHNLKSETPITYEEFVSINKDENHVRHKEIKDIRKKAKVTNFLDIFCGTAASLGEKMLLPESQAQEMLDAKHSAFTGVEVWKERMNTTHTELGFAVEKMGRRRHLRLDGTWQDKHELRSAINHTIQGSAASQIKLALSKIWNQKVLERFNAYFMFSIHDQIDFSVKHDQVLDFIRTIHPIMTAHYVDFPVEFESSIEIGKNFGELVEIGTKIDEKRILEEVKKIRAGRFEAQEKEEEVEIEDEGEEEVEYSEY